MSNPAKQRSCIGCREVCAQNELVRFWHDGQALRTGRGAAGRGAWLHPTQSCLALAVKRNGFQRALHIQLSPADLAWLSTEFGNADA